MRAISICELKVELQSLGVRTEGDKRGRKSGAGPAAGMVLLFDNGSQVNVPTMSWFVEDSPYSLHPIAEDRFILKYKEEEITTVAAPPIPRFYSLKTASGIPYWKIALLHGKDCLSTTVLQHCIHWNTKDVCKFCAIGLSLREGRTIARKRPEDLAEVAKHAVELDDVKHVTLTTGSTRDETRCVKILKDAASAIKEVADLAIHVQLEPLENTQLFHELKSAGVDTVGIHIESFDHDVLKVMAPCKAKLGFDRYIKAWESAVEIFGAGEVSTFIIAGLGESDRSIIEGSAKLASIGVYPFIVPLRPIPGTPLERFAPPEPARMLSIYSEVARLLRDYRISWKTSRAGCVRCMACSAMGDFEL
ncbi:MAG: radical SAM protein [Candidatus Syntrophoarchaeum caldarius]|uniref:Radical SAM protein n=1 Tax=Candidatus Syntropharchaeum caldarium TaxID=1838285 RepID=A0A1F2P8V5_9EURY|nr:MAG: radical SAM protein [Candidatus Syntrophoarchaeum caldarius]